ncbi:MAG: hypothetical protein IR159_08860 [Brevundimonas sp.]|nr:hypothetical protein [Brevundimonas sp.]
MADMPRNRHGLIPMLVAIRVTAERRRREAERQAAAGKGDGETPEAPKKRKERGWFG